MNICHALRPAMHEKTIIIHAQERPCVKTCQRAFDALEQYFKRLRPPKSQRFNNMKLKFSHSLYSSTTPAAIIHTLLRI